MCLATPLKVLGIEGNKAVVGSENHQHVVDISLLKEVKIGDYLLIHGELAINKVAEDDAKQIQKYVSRFHNRKNGGESE